MAHNSVYISEVEQSNNRCSVHCCERPPAIKRYIQVAQ